MRALPILAIAMLLALEAASAPALDYTFFKERVQPIFLKKRPGHARCVTCHEHGSPPLPALEPKLVETTLVEPRRAVAETPRSISRSIQ